MAAQLQPDRFSPDCVDRSSSWGPSRDFLKFAIGMVFAGSAAAMLALFFLIPDQSARALRPALLLPVAVLASYCYWRGQMRAVLQVLVRRGRWIPATARAPGNTVSCWARKSAGCDRRPNFT